MRQTLKTWIVSGLLFCAAAIPVQAAFDTNALSIRGTTDKNPLSYVPGEEMKFTLTVDLKGQTPDRALYLKWDRSGDDGNTDGGKVKVDGKPFTFSTKINKPGFVRIYAYLVDEKGDAVKRIVDGKPGDSIWFEGGAGVQFERLKGTPEPEDFDAFWQKQKAKLDTVPMTVEKVQLHAGNSAAVYKVKVACPGPRPMTGYLTVPNNAKDKSVPAEVCYMGYGYDGVRDREPGDGPADRIRLVINPHGYDLCMDQAYYDAFEPTTHKPGVGYAFSSEENKDPETAYFNGMSLRVLRSLQFVKSLPQWNGKDLYVSGGSQGGLQTIWAAAQDKDVTKADASIPWCCDLGGGKNFGRVQAGWRIPYVRGLDYYDPINHALRITCPTTIGRAGLGDYVCPPSGVAVLYNNLKCRKSISWFQGSTHGFVPPEAEVFTYGVSIHR